MLFQVTQAAKGAEVHSEVFDNRPRLYQAKFDLGGVLPGGTGRTAKRAAANDIFEIYRLRPFEQIGRCSVNSTKTVSGTYALRIIDGTIGAEPDSSVTPAITRNLDVTLIQAITGSATLDRGANDDWASYRSADDRDKDNAVAFVCTTASSANETAIFEITLEIYTQDFRS